MAYIEFIEEQHMFEQLVLNFSPWGHLASLRQGSRARHRFFFWLSPQTFQCSWNSSGSSLGPRSTVFGLGFLSLTFFQLHKVLNPSSVRGQATSQTDLFSSASAKAPMPVERSLTWSACPSCPTLFCWSYLSRVLNWKMNGIWTGLNIYKGVRSGL